MPDNESPSSRSPVLAPVTITPHTSRTARWSSRGGYGLALLGVGLTWLILGSLAMAPLRELLLLPIIVSAFLGGPGPGLLATAMAAMLTGDILAAGGPERARWVVLLSAGVLVSALSGALQRARRHAETGQELQAAIRLQGERTLQLFVEHAPAAIAMFDRSMTYLAASRRYLVDYRLDAQDIVGRSHYEIFPDLPEGWKAIHQRCLAGTVEIADEDPFPRADGTIDWVRWEIHPWYQQPGEVGGIILFSEVITARKQAELELREQEARFHQTLDSMLEGCQIIGFDWRYRYLNESAARHARCPRADLLGRTMMEAFPGIDQTPMFALLQRCMQERISHRLENRFDYGDGSSAWFDLSIQPSPEGAFILSIDITERKHAEAELLELNRTLEARVAQRTAEVQDLYDNAPTGYHSLDAAGAVILVNQTELDWLGYSRDEMIGRPLADFLTPASWALVQANFPAFKQHGWLRSLELEFIRKDGTTFPALINATAIYDATGAFQMSRSTVFDITLRKQADAALRESEAQNRLLFESAPDAVILFDARGQVVRMNHAFERMSGYTAAELTGRTLDAAGIVTPERTVELQATVIQTLEGEDGFATVEWQLTRANGETRDVGARVFALQIQGERHYLTTLRDITAEKQAAEALRLANAELARAARAKDEFLANMSHELRTPLNAILTFSESLQEQIYGPLNERQQRSLHNIEASGRHLLTLITDILDLSKVEAGRLELEIVPVQVAELCQASLLFVKEQALKKAIKLQVELQDMLAIVEADPKRLKQMLVNLLSNAVKFTPNHGEVRLAVAADAAAGEIHFVVHDTGIGMRPEDLERLFQPFTQLDSSLSRQHEGTGLGLALVHRLAELHGGSVSVESAVGAGSRFTITLPYRPPALAEPPPAAESPAAGLGEPAPIHTALVVEDTQSAADQLVRYLQELRIDARVHPQGDGALALACSLQPDVILLDLLIPRPTGWKVLAQLKADPRTRDIPVIIVSVVDERAKGLAAGAAEYLVKPISRGMLQQVLRSVAAAREAARQTLASAPQPQVAPFGPRILLAEDNEANIQSLQEYLSAKGYEVIIARTGREAIARAAEERVDIILMDIQMPEIDGIEAIRRLRAAPNTAITPIIALTALAMPGDRERCLEAGADDYLTKPVSLKGLVATIGRWAHR
jgi:PAS domain S-box-containing protein